MKKWLKPVGWICLVPIALIALLSLLLYIPAIQDFSVRKAATYASEAMGMDIGIERIRLSFPLDLTIKNVTVVDAPADTLLSLRSLTVRIRALPLFRQHVLIDAIDLQGVTLNTGEMIEGMEVKGFLGKLHIKADHIDLGKETATFNAIDLSDTAITLILNDTTTTEEEEDTTSTPINWAVALEEIRLDRVAFALQMPSDSLRLTAFIREAGLEEGRVDLGDERYTFDRFQLTDAAMTYDANYAAPAEGLDAAHIRLSKVNTLIEGLSYKGTEINAHIDHITAEERSGLALTTFKGRIQSEKGEIQVPELLLQTPYSEMRLTAGIPWSSLEEHPKGNLNASLNAYFGKEDLCIVAASLPEDFMNQYPESPMRLTVNVEGNMDDLRLTQGELTLPEAFQVNLSGRMEALMDSLRRSGEIQLDTRGGNLDFVLAMLPPEQRDQFAIPTDLQLSGIATIADQAYNANFLLTQDKGKIDLTAHYDPTALAYEVHLQVDSLEPTHFLPKDSLYWVTASLDAEGAGTDFFAPETWAKLTGTVSDIRYGTSSVSDVHLNGSLEKNKAKLDLHSDYPLAQMDLSLDAFLQKDNVQAKLNANVENADLYGMHFSTTPFSTSFQLAADVESDFNENNRVNMTLANWELNADERHIQPETLTLHARTDADTIGVTFHAGDMDLILNSDNGISGLTEKLTKVTDEMTAQLERDSTIDLNLLSPFLPDLSLNVQAGQENPIYRLLQLYNIAFQEISMSLSTSAKNGLRMDAFVSDLMMDTTKIDTIQMVIHQDSLGLTYSAEVFKNPYRHQFPFSAGLDGHLRHGTVSTRLQFKNGAGDTGLLLGVQADKEVSGAKIHLFPEEPILAFRPFQLNVDNHVTLRSLTDIAADVRLTGENNASLWIHSEKESTGQEGIRVELTDIDLGILSQAIDYLPKIEGLLNANLLYAASDSTFLATAEVGIDSLYYEDQRVGDLQLSASYLPQGGDAHQVDLHFLKDQEEVTTINALYATGETGDRIEGTFDLSHFPLDMANPFIPDNMAKMEGEMNAAIAINGSSENPQIEGSFQLDSVSIYVTDAGSSFRFDNKPIVIKDNRLTFNKYGIYAYNENPLVIDGSVDFSDLSRMTADLKLTADNMQVLNVKKNKESLVYGKLFTNLNATAQGAVDALDIRGDLQLLGGTNITYVLKDSPLTVEDRMSDMVTFTSFTDTLQYQKDQKQALPIGGMNMLMTIRIDEAVQANVALDEDGSNHIDLAGGGDLSFQYTAQGDMVLNGRYTLTGGTIKYALPVIPLKDFTIQEGSYVQWSGDAMDPTLNLTATERVRTSVTPSGESSPRSINFDVGISLTERLENLGLQFTLDAPEDLTMQEELDSKGLEERSKLAVSMLVTGMYLGSDNEGKINLNMGNALSSFLQNEINNLAGNALKSVDISFGMETYDEAGESGTSSRTDYSFRFAKRFYNDRIRIVLGGRISTGESVNDGQAQPFIDNIAVEYRLDSGGSRYVKLFHDKTYDSLLEGEITETGGGIVLRKKMLHLKELFNFKKKTTKTVSEEE